MAQTTEGNGGRQPVWRQDLFGYRQMGKKYRFNKLQDCFWIAVGAVLRNADKVADTSRPTEIGK